MTYTHAIVRYLSDSFSQGVTTAGLGYPNVKKAREQHEKYCKTLEDNGIKLIRLPELEYFPDSVFVEDIAIKVNHTFVIGRAGVQSRRGENTDVVKVLDKRFDLEFIKFPGTIEGGDVIRIRDHYFIGLSSRTNYHGIIQFINILDKEGFTYSIIPVRNVLHLKTGISVLESMKLYGSYFNIIFCEEFFYKWFVYPFLTPNILTSSYTFMVGKDESYAANILKLNDSTVVVPKGYPIVWSKVKSLAKVIELDMSEFQKMDGSLTCLSILF